MKKLIFLAVLSVTGIILPGCATVRVYSDEGLKNETGLRFYTLKPYLLVEYMANKDNTVSTSVIYLPDLYAPQYLVVKAGLGSGELKATFRNSSLESYGVVTDSQLPESMAAFADILSKSAYAAQTFSQSRSPVTATDSETPAFRLFEIIITPSGTVLKEVSQ
jgi:hypothetical protein